MAQLAVAASQSPQPEARINALDDYSYGAQSSESLAMLKSAFADEKPDVRIAALNLIKDTNDTIPVDAVNQLISLDTDAAVRARALVLLAERAEPGVAKPSLEAALNDAAPEVRAMAREVDERFRNGDGFDRLIGAFLAAFADAFAGTTPACQWPKVTCWRTPCSRLSTAPGDLTALPLLA